MTIDQMIEPAEKQQKTTTSQRVTELTVTGMTCANCARQVAQAIQSAAGVQSATVSLEVARATVHWKSDGPPDLAGVIRAIEEAGYGAKVADAPTHEHGPHKLAAWQMNLWLGVLGTVPLMIGEWGFGLGMVPWFRWLSFILAGLVQVLAGARFYRGAWAQLKVGSSNMDTLVALGSTTAFAYSTWALLGGRGGHLYFVEAAAIITLISIGHWLESRVSVRASNALRKLLNLAPAMARRLNGDGTEAEVPVAELQTGDSAVLRPGDSVPTDGQVVEGQSAVDESMLTGESTPVNKAPRSQVYAGTHNMNGRLVMQVTAIGEQTALAQIIAAVQRAQTSRANIQRLGDRVASVFVPLVVLVALAAGLWWGLAPESARLFHAGVAHFLWFAQPPENPLAAALIIAAAVLIIACPCAMGLATPAAIMAGSNAAAERGILIRDGVALEKAGKITAVLFDKTGTLTEGRPSVGEVWEQQIGNPKSQAEDPETDGIPLLHMAAALAQHSTHPISQAVARLATERTPTNSREGRSTTAGNPPLSSNRPVPLADWQEVRGAGVQGRVRSLDGQARLARLGSLAWLSEAGVDVAAGQAFVEHWSAQGATLVGVALDESLRGLFAVRDTIKPGARAVVSQLQRQGLTTYLVTGDNRLTAATIAGQAGIQSENVFAEVPPEQKAQFVKKLQQQGLRVAFVGDGINDAPALEQADLGIAVSRASDIAREAADIILLNSEIEAVPESLGLARATLRTIKQNLFWAFFYNAVGVPLAALGFMSPILCAAAMGLSDLVVLGNALRLRHWRS